MALDDEQRDSERREDRREVADGRRGDRQEVATFKRHIRVNVVRACAILVLVLLGVTYSVGEKILDGQKREHAYALGSCKRGNEGRIRENRSALGDYLFYTATAKLLEGAIGQARPLRPTETPAEAKRIKHVLSPYTRQLPADARYKEWQPLLDCYSAINHPSTYTLGAAVPFAVRMPPPTALGEHPAGPSEHIQ